MMSKYDHGSNDMLLAALYAASEDELDSIRNVLNKKLSVRMTGDLTHVPGIAKEIKLMGGNTLANLWRGEGVSYQELLLDTAMDLKIEPTSLKGVDVVGITSVMQSLKKQWLSAEEIEQLIVSKVLHNSLSNMSEEDLKQFMDELGLEIDGKLTVAIANKMAMGLFRAGGFKSYTILVTIVNGTLKALGLGGLSLAGNATLTRLAALWAKSFGNWLSAALVVASITGPAKSIRLPLVLLIAMIRTEHNLVTNDAYTDAIISK